LPSPRRAMSIRFANSILNMGFVFCEQQLEDSTTPEPPEQSAAEKATHDLKNILFTTKQIYELWAEGSFGPVSEQQAEILKLLLADNSRVIEILGF
jgi:hypothetical protein